MTALELTTIALAGLWLAILSLGTLLLIRQVGVLTVQLEIASRRFPPSNDGLGIGIAVPDDVLSGLPELGTGLHYILGLSSTCDPCRALVEGLSSLDLPRSVFAFLSGPSQPAEGFVALLPENVHVIRDPEAGAFLGSLEIHTTPFAIEVDDGVISGNSVLSGPVDLLRLVQARQGDSQSANGPIEEPIRVRR